MIIPCIGGYRKIFPVCILAVNFQRGKEFLSEAGSGNIVVKEKCQVKNSYFGCTCNSCKKETFDKLEFHV